MGKKIGVYFRGKKEGGSVIPSRLLKKNIDLFATFYIVKLNGFSDHVFISSANPGGGIGPSVACIGFCVGGATGA